MTDPRAAEALSFDLFGTLVTADRPADPAGTLRAALDDRGVRVPDDWAVAYRESHVDAPDGAEVSLPAHVRAALASRGVEVSSEPVREAVAAAFDTSVRTRPGATRAVAAAAERGPVGVLSNCSVPGLAEAALDRSDVDRRNLDAVVASVDCGWRKPDPRAFEAAAAALGVGVPDLCHVGDDPRTDAAATRAGASAVLVEDLSLPELADRLEGTE